MNKTLSLLLLVVALCIVPFFITRGAEFSGSDDQAEGVISQLASDYQPWFEPLFEPASGEIESLLFTLQGALGTAVIFYIFGFYNGKRARENEQAQERKSR